ncbi:hypothetical protein [Actinomadura logoneensis]|uniref:hypothetical protein n=1 Tax=Actinomadura logoneensis TaxID=2293572 RepID=UPI001314AFDB|nr:hypothetical protein [Actinomadura logoneensis]
MIAGLARIRTLIRMATIQPGWMIATGRTQVPFVDTKGDSGSSDVYKPNSAAA